MLNSLLNVEQLANGRGSQSPEPTLSLSFSEVLVDQLPHY